MSSLVEVTLALETLEQLRQSYMPFVQEGGIFLPMAPCLSMGDRVLLHLVLPNETVSTSVEGKVVWITPQGVPGHRVSGVGVQFQGSDCLKEKIENLLRRCPSATVESHTL